MGKPTGFMEYPRKDIGHLDPRGRVRTFQEFGVPLDEKERQEQGARCMDCGIPFCQSSYGCPVDNLIPEWNDLIFHGNWEKAFYRLMRTNNFPEYTGRVCPAPCETACVLGINEPAVTIKDNECAIIDRAYRTGLMKPRIPEVRTGKRVAIVGSGPAGLAAADQLNQAGHTVTVFERDDRIGGLLMYGIPNMKLDKTLVQQRNAVMAAEGIEFRTGVEVGCRYDPEKMMSEYDAVLLACGSTVPRNLEVPGRDLKGVHFAMEFLKGSTRHLLDGGSGGTSSPEPSEHTFITARNRNVIVIGGGDTGNDCIGTSIRQGCLGLKNFELLSRPASGRTEEFPWPLFPRVYKTDYGHEEIAARFGEDPREFGILTKEFLGNSRGEVEAVRTVRVEWEKAAGERPRLKEVPGSGQIWKTDLVLLAMGFLGPENGIAEAFGVETDARSNLKAEYGAFITSRTGVFAAGDARRGQSLVVWAIKEGRGAAREIDLYLMGETNLV
jgi:glutamate synthase (NADPH) small chain